MYGKESILNTKVKDPVCGMEVDIVTATAQTTYRGMTYYFCSMEDKAKFDKEPQRYVNKTKQPEHNH